MVIFCRIRVKFGVEFLQSDNVCNEFVRYIKSDSIPTPNQTVDDQHDCPSLKQMFNQFSLARKNLTVVWT